jgi:hypothetical protein
MNTVTLTVPIIDGSVLLLASVSADTEEEATAGAHAILETPELVEFLWRLEP